MARHLAITLKAPQPHPNYLRSIWSGQLVCWRNYEFRILVVRLRSTSFHFVPLKHTNYYKQLYLFKDHIPLIKLIRFTI